VLADSARAPGH